VANWIYKASVEPIFNRVFSVKAPPKWISLIVLVNPLVKVKGTSKAEACWPSNKSAFKLVTKLVEPTERKVPPTERLEIVAPAERF